MSSRMLKKSASDVLALLRGAPYHHGKEPVSAGSGRAGKNVTHRLFARCGLGWDKASLWRANRVFPQPASSGARDALFQCRGT